MPDCPGPRLSQPASAQRDLFSISRCFNTTYGPPSATIRPTRQSELPWFPSWSVGTRVRKQTDRTKVCDRRREYLRLHTAMRRSLFSSAPSRTGRTNRCGRWDQAVGLREESPVIGAMAEPLGQMRLRPQHRRARGHGLPGNSREIAYQHIVYGSRRTSDSRTLASSATDIPFPGRYR